MNKKVLVIEDETSLRFLLCERLSSENFQIFSASNGVDGLSLALQEKPNLILLDIMMPGIDGNHVLEEIRKNDWGKKAHVIILTNLNTSEELAKALELEAFEFYVKSNIKIEDLMQKIIQYLKK